MRETSIERRQRAMGALVGSIVGDVLGSPFTGAAPGAYRERFPRPVFAGDGELAGDDPGRWTAHSSAALRVAESLRDCGALDEDDLRRSRRAGVAPHAHDPRGPGVRVAQPRATPSTSPSASAC